jgi:hypothetical protein
VDYIGKMLSTLDRRGCRQEVRIATAAKEFNITAEWRNRIVLTELDERRAVRS